MKDKPEGIGKLKRVRQQLYGGFASVGFPGNKNNEHEQVGPQKNVGAAVPFPYKKQDHQYKPLENYHQG